MPFSSNPKLGRFDLIVVGSGFSSSFFLHGYLRKASPTVKVLVLERGPNWSHAQQVAKRQSSPFVEENLYRKSGRPEKRWLFTVGFGGGSNCWWSNTPRFLPSDFETRSRFGVGRDWPFSYNELAPYYDAVEEVMSIAGPASGPCPRTKPYPQPPHRLNAPELLLKAAYPAAFFEVPTGRARIATPGRGICCANGVCRLCPVDAKFTIQNGMMSIFDDPRVEVVTEAEVSSIETEGGRARALRFVKDEREQLVRGDLFALGANALFNPVILQSSGLAHPLLGKRLHEQVGVSAEIMLRGVDSFQGSTSVTGHGYMLYTDERRRSMAGCLIETWNVGLLRTESGRWRQVLPLRLVFEDLPNESNYVAINPNDVARPIMHYEGHSDYTARAIKQIRADLERVMAPLPVEAIVIKDKPEDTEAHIMGTTVMGSDPNDSIVDGYCIHHQVRNIVVLGSGTFPVSGPANPTLTICAQALRASDRIMS